MALLMVQTCVASTFYKISLRIEKRQNDAATKHRTPQLASTGTQNMIMNTILPLYPIKQTSEEVREPLSAPTSHLDNAAVMRPWKEIGNRQYTIHTIFAYYRGVRAKKVSYTPVPGRTETPRGQYALILRGLNNLMPCPPKRVEIYHSAQLDAQMDGFGIVGAKPGSSSLQYVWTISICPLPHLVTPMPKGPQLRPGEKLSLCGQFIVDAKGIWHPIPTIEGHGPTATVPVFEAAARDEKTLTGGKGIPRRRASSTEANHAKAGGSGGVSTGARRAHLRSLSERVRGYTEHSSSAPVSPLSPFEGSRSTTRLPHLGSPDFSAHTKASTPSSVQLQKMMAKSLRF
eukprot:jgi/Mesvir1/2836/Mv13926-RA.1